MNRKKLAIGILTYQRTDLLIDTLSDLEPIFDKVNIYIVNNNEDMCVKDDITSKFHSIDFEYIWYKKNLGVSEGRNQLISKCKEEVIVLLDDDVRVPEPNKLYKEVISEFNYNNNLGALAFNIVDERTRTHNRFEIPHKNKAIDMNSDFQTYLIIGAGNAINVSKARQVGNFPLDFGVYGFEEIDLAFRLINAGFLIKYKSNIKIIHRKSPDGRFSGELVNYLYFVNRTRMAKRYFKRRYFITTFLARGLFFLMKTRKLSLFFEASRVIFKDKKCQKFDKSFYEYIKSSKGFIWY